MGEQRIREVTMVALIFLLLGVVFLLLAAGRIWIDATPSKPQTIDSTMASTGARSLPVDRTSVVKELGVQPTISVEAGQGRSSPT